MNTDTKRDHKEKPKTLLGANQKQKMDPQRSELLRVLTSGGDERIRLLENGKNKYSVNPVDFEHSIQRGSCTCNTLNPDSLKAVGCLLNETRQSEFTTLLEWVRDEMKSMISPDDENSFELFLAPSGSDLNYYPLMFRALLEKRRPILNIATCPEELGTGSTFAAEGKYFFTQNQFGEVVDKGSKLPGIGEIQMKYFPSRDDEGMIFDHKSALVEHLGKRDKSTLTICNLVLGSKSGIENNLSVIPRFQKNVMWVVDMCQMRAQKNTIQRLLDLNAMIMITGSKFFQSPPFCGALLVPKYWVDKLSEVDDLSAAKSFTSIFSKNDFPPTLERLQSVFRHYENSGLLLRWGAALSEMKAITAIDLEKILEMVDRWHEVVTGQIRRREDAFTLMPDGDLTNKTIISFKVKDRNGEYLGDEQHRKIFNYLAEHTFPELGYKNLIIGQPVSYDSESFIRLAIGSYNIRTFLKEGLDPQFEEGVVDVIYRTARQLY